jgi:hypothetical protein
VSKEEELSQGRKLMDREKEANQARKPMGKRRRGESS